MYSKMQQMCPLDGSCFIEMNIYFVAVGFYKLDP